MNADPAVLAMRQRPPAEWLAELRHADADVRARAVGAWRELAGPLRAALPDLVAALRDSSPAVRREAAGAVGALGHVGLSVSQAARSALTMVADVDDDESVRTRALDELLVLGPVTHTPLPALVEALRDGLPEVRRGAAEAIGELGSRARDSIGALIQAQYDPDAGVLVQVARSLWRVDRRDRIAVPILTRVLGDADEVIRWQAADALAEIGPAAADAVPALRTALDGQYRSSLIREAVATALKKIESSGDA
jgi:HEAT repeat protein